MDALRLVPPDGVRASSSSKLETSSSTSANLPSQRQIQVQHLQQAFYQSWHGAQHRTSSSSRPFVASLEPIDTTPEQRARNILCQKVLILAASLFPKAASSDDLRVEYVGSGSYHEVVGFSVPTLQRVDANANDASDHCRFVIEEDKHVVRIPREDVVDHNTDMLRDVAVLKGLEGRLQVPIPRVVAFDATKGNVLDAPYTLETRLRGCSLEDLLNKTTASEQDESALRQVVQLVESLAALTAPYGGHITEEFEDDVDRRLFESRIPVRLFGFPFDASSLTSLPDQTPLTFILALVHLWVEYEHEHCPNEDNSAYWNKIKAIVLSLQRRDLLGDTFHLSHGDLASRNILAELGDDASIVLTGVVDWDFACFAPKFCAYRAPLDMWEGDENEAIEQCTPDLIQAFKKTASAEYVRYAFSKEAKTGRDVWSTVRSGMLSEDRRWRASKSLWDWERLHPEDEIGKFQ